MGGSKRKLAELPSCWQMHAHSEMTFDLGTMRIKQQWTSSTYVTIIAKHQWITGYITTLHKYNLCSTPPHQWWRFVLLLWDCLLHSYTYAENLIMQFWWHNLEHSGECSECLTTDFWELSRHCHSADIGGVCSLLRNSYSICVFEFLSTTKSCPWAVCMVP